MRSVYLLQEDPPWDQALVGAGFAALLSIFFCLAPEDVDALPCALIFPIAGSGLGAMLDGMKKATEKRLV